MTAHELLSKNLESIQLILKDQSSILDLIKKEGGEVKILKSCGAECHCRKMLREILNQTIDVLEESKKSFKSRRLEELRRKLIAVLSETE